ncbi:MAG: hypothetical protein JNG88_14490 [Phycisphaerales bacterium]|nr:hypothetical protein [Phycisphaerales bacterium]
MPPTNDGPKKLAIKKYPNRRFYDTTRSCHVSSSEIHDLIVDGYEVEITDSATGENITNAFLTQLILEHHAPKLSIFPAQTLHQIIRTQQQLLGGVVEQYFRQWADSYRASHERWTELMRMMFGATPPMTPTSSAAINPMDWTRAWLDAMSGTARGSQTSSPASAAGSDQSGEIAELRRQLDALSRKLDEGRD